MIRINLLPRMHPVTATRKPSRWTGRSALLLSCLVHTVALTAAIGVSYEVPVARPRGGDGGGTVQLRLAAPGPDGALDFSAGTDGAATLPAPAEMPAVEIFEEMEKFRTPLEEPLSSATVAVPPDPEPPLRRIAVSGSSGALKVPATRSAPAAGTAGGSEGGSLGGSGGAPGTAGTGGGGGGNGTGDGRGGGPGTAYAPSVPAAVGNAPPAYPREAVREGLEGRALVRALVDASGRPVRVELAASSGHAILDAAALDAVRGWTFRPAVRGGVPESSVIQIPIVFRLVN